MTYVTPDAMTLSWTVPEGEFDSFVVQYKDRDGQPRVVPVATDQREVTIPGLEPGRKYKFLLYGLAGRKRLGPISADGTTGEPSHCTPPFLELPSLVPPEPSPHRPIHASGLYSPTFSLCRSKNKYLLSLGHVLDTFLSML